MSGLKKCPKCAEMVQSDAKVCKHCGHKFYQAAGCLIVGLLGIAGIVYLGSGESQVDKNNSDAPMVSVAEQKRCATSLSEMQSAGLIKSRPEPNRLDVDDRVWSMMPAKDKEMLMAIAACEVHRRAQPNIQAGERIYVYGYISGKQLAMLNYSGPTFE